MEKIIIKYKDNDGINRDISLLELISNINYTNDINIEKLMDIPEIIDIKVNNNVVWSKEFQIVMIPTNEYSPFGPGNIFLCLQEFEEDYKLIRGEVSCRTSMGDDFSKKHGEIIQVIGTPQHLYILSDDEIVERDWCLRINPDKSIIGQPFKATNIEGLCQSGFKKIIYTTDSRLEFLSYPPLDIIDKFLEKYNTFKKSVKYFHVNIS